MAALVYQRLDFNSCPLGNHSVGSHGGLFCAGKPDEMMSGPATRPTPKRWDGVDVAADGPVG